MRRLLGRVGVATKSIISKPLSEQLILRPYQRECISSILKAFEENRRAAVSLPTGSGKTVIFCELIRSVLKPGKRALVIVNRREIAKQVRDTLVRSGMTAGIDSGTEGYSDEKKVLVGTIQTLMRPARLEKYDPTDFGLIVIDEAHHSAASSYFEVLSHFGALENSSKLKVLGVSATFWRHDDKALGSIFDDIVYHQPLQAMMEDGYLCKAKLTKIHVEREKYMERAQAFLSNDGLNLVVNSWKQTHPYYDSTVIFTIDTKHIDLLVTRFRSNGIDARALHGRLTSRQRDQVLSDFRDKKFPVLVNCGVLTEGTDIPSIDQIILARPLKSISLTLQMVGRGLRKWPGKEHCNIIQFPELMDSELVSKSIEPSLRSLGMSLFVEDSANTEEKHGTKDRPQYTEDSTLGENFFLKETEFNVLDLFKTAQTKGYAWVWYSGKFFLFLGRGSLGYFRVSRVKNSGDWVAEAKFFRKGRNYCPKPIEITVDSNLSRVKLAAEVAAEQQAGYRSRFLKSEAEWRKKELTSGQLRFFEKLDIPPESMPSSAGEASDVISLIRVGYKPTESLFNKTVTNLNSARTKD